MYFSKWLPGTNCMLKIISSLTQSWWRIFDSYTFHVTCVNSLYKSCQHAESSFIQVSQTATNSPTPKVEKKGFAQALGERESRLPMHLPENDEFRSHSPCPKCLSFPKHFPNLCQWVCQVSKFQARSRLSLTCHPCLLHSQAICLITFRPLRLLSEENWKPFTLCIFHQDLDFIISCWYKSGKSVLEQNYAVLLNQQKITTWDNFLNDK